MKLMKMLGIQAISLNVLDMHRISLDPQEPFETFFGKCSDFVQMKENKLWSPKHLFFILVLDDYYFVLKVLKLHINKLMWSPATKPPATTRLQIPRLRQNSESTDFSLLYLY